MQIYYMSGNYSSDKEKKYLKRYIASGSATYKYEIFCFFYYTYQQNILYNIAKLFFNSDNFIYFAGTTQKYKIQLPAVMPEYPELTNTQQAMFKYKDDIEILNACSIVCPPEDVFPTNGNMYRFSHQPDCELCSNNHLPVFKQTPSRRLRDQAKGEAVASLSCFETEAQAVGHFEQLKAEFPNLRKTLGCQLVKVDVEKNDGVRSLVSANGLFNFFESHDCNFSVKELPIRNL